MNAEDYARGLRWCPERKAMIEDHCIGDYCSQWAPDVLRPDRGTCGRSVGRHSFQNAQVILQAPAEPRPVVGPPGPPPKLPRLP